MVIVPDEWLTVFYVEQMCPQCEETQPLYRLIPHLNDEHRWTREQIALLVERVERTREEHQQSAITVVEKEEEWPEEIGSEL